MKTLPTVMLSGLAISAPVFAASNDHSGVDAIALYSQGAAVVQDSRTVKLDKGEQTLPWPIAGAVKPDTLWLSGSGVQLTGFDLDAGHGGSGKNLLAGRVGRSVTLDEPDGKTRQGTLVATKGQAAYVRVNDRIERITAASHVQISWPAAQDDEKQGDSADVRLHVKADKAGKRKLTATYQADAPSWQASYTGRFDPKNGKLELAAHAVVDNSGHGALDADKAWLVAGDTSRADNGHPRPMMMARMASSSSQKTGQPQAVGDVYRYPLSDGLHVAAGATQSMMLMSPIRVDARRRYHFDNQALADTGDARQHARLSLTFDNSSKQQPLPGGSVRVYDAGHTAHLMGGGHIDDTPAGAPVKLSLGGAFDITGTHRVTRRSSGDDGTRTTQVTIKLFNAGDEKKQVTVAERLPGNAQLADDAPKTSGGSATQPEWQVNVPADGHKTLRYRFTQSKSS